MLLFSHDDHFWGNLLSAAAELGRMLVRKAYLPDAMRIVQRVEPAAILLDLDPPSATTWNTADALLQDRSAPPLLLLTTSGNHMEFNPVLQAGWLIRKSEPAARVLELAELALNHPHSKHQERIAAQQSMIRWLKPFNWSPQVAPLRRFWGINE